MEFGNTLLTYSDMNDDGKVNAMDYCRLVKTILDASETEEEK